MGNKLAKFCGKFEDRHTEPDSEDLGDDDDTDLIEDESSMLPKDYERIKRDLLRPEVTWLSRLRGAGTKPPDPLKFANSDAVAVKMWLRKTTTVAIEEDVKGGGQISRRAPAIIVNDQKLPKVMLKKLRTFNNMHTIELNNCGLKECPPSLTEIEGLRVLRFSRNQIKCIRKDLTRTSDNKFTQLQRIIVDCNQIDMIELGAFVEQAVTELVVLNFGKNQLSMLPIDFCQRAICLEILDLSFNHLEGLPDSIMECSNLRILDVCNNRLKALPEGLDKLKRLRKLFVNTNQLAYLPETIGECKKLEKLWVSDNRLRYLPYSVIDLWKGEGGVLEEIMVDDNPLVLPSVTAFQMGGPNQMFRLFKEHREEEKRRKMQQDMLTIADAPQGQRQAALRDVAGGGPDDPTSIGADEGHAFVPRANAETHAGHEGDEEEGDAYAMCAAIEDVPEEPDEEVPANTKPPGDYYFHGHHDDYGYLAKIRTAESSLMLLKRQMYVDQIRELAKTRSVEAKKAGQAPPAHLEKYISKDFTVQTFKGNVHITDLDVSFCMFVMSAKALSGSCEQLFNKFTPGGDMDRKCWDHFCARVPAKLTDELKSSMFRLITWRSGHDAESAAADVYDFTAAMHIHDIAECDPFVARVAQVLKLKYYGMTMTEFETKIRVRGHDTHTALESIDFPSDDEDEGAATLVAGHKMDDEAAELAAAVNQDTDFMPAKEGERMTAVEAQEAILQSHGKKATGEKKKRRGLVSMSEAQYCQMHDGAEAEDTEDVHDTAFELSSSELSNPDSSDESFDADDCLEEIEKIEQEQVAAAALSGSGAKAAFQVTNADDLEKLMSAPPRQIVSMPEEESPQMQAMNEAGARAKEKKAKAAKEREKKRQKQLAGATMVRDPRFGTNMMTVRKAFRDAYRNLPYNDFVAFVNFLLRGLKHIKHYEPAVHITYWHSDDPVIRHLMGHKDTNKYPSQVLREMGFLLVYGPENDADPDELPMKRSAYWVWPEKHLRELGDRTRKKLVPSHCPGTEKMRLDDLIKFVTHCRKSLDKARSSGTVFTGHCKAS